MGIDLFYIPDHENHLSVPVLNVVDLGTNYQVAEMVANIKNLLPFGELSEQPGVECLVYRSTSRWMKDVSFEESLRDGVRNTALWCLGLQQEHLGNKGK